MEFNLRGYFGGLGDQLQWSWAPEILSNLGHKVSLYTGPDVLQLRNEGIKNLVYDHNPFIKGESDVEWNLGDLPGKNYVNHGLGFIGNWAKSLGFEPSGESLPKIYYPPKVIEGKFGLVELSAIHHKYNPERVIRTVKSMIDKSGIPIKQVTSANQANKIKIPDIEEVFVEDLFQLSDLIFSCTTFVSLCSGSHSLAAAIRRFNSNIEQICLIPESDWDWVMESKKFVYPGVEYFRENGKSY